MPSRRHCRQTGPIYRAKSNLPQTSVGAVYNPRGLLPAYSNRSLAGAASIKLQTQTLRFFGGRQPLCGTGVRSLIPLTSSPAVDNARTADSRPAPGPLTSTFTVRNPDSFALFAAVSDACCAAKGVPLRDPRKPSEPELDHDKTLPTGSVTVMMVLLKDACTWTMPTGTDFFSFFLKAFFLPALAGAFVAMLVLIALS